MIVMFATRTARTTRISLCQFWSPVLHVQITVRGQRDVVGFESLTCNWAGFNLDVGSVDTPPKLSTVSNLCCSRSYFFIAIYSFPKDVNVDLAIPSFF